MILKLSKPIEIHGIKEKLQEALKIDINDNNNNKSINFTVMHLDELTIVL